MHRRDFLTRCAVVGFGLMAPVSFKTASRIWTPPARKIIRIEIFGHDLSGNSIKLDIPRAEVLRLGDYPFPLMEVVDIPGSAEVLRVVVNETEYHPLEGQLFWGPMPKERS